MPKKLFLSLFALTVLSVGIFWVLSAQATTTIGANITSAGTLTVATTTPYNGFWEVNGDLNQSGNYKIYQNYLPVFVASSTSKSLSVGTEAGKNLTDGGTQNIFLGYQAGYTNTTGDSNTAVGYQALYNNTTGGSNIALGNQALYFNTAGSNNIGIGMFTLQGLGTGSDYNIAIGIFSGVSSGNNNISIGTFAQNSISDAFANVAIGYRAGGMTGSGYSSSTILGYGALSGMVTGNGNIALGYKAADNITTGSNNIVIGYDIDAPSASSANTLNIGNIIFGTGLTGTGTTIAGQVGIATSTPWADMELSVAGDILLTGTLYKSTTAYTNPDYVFAKYFGNPKNEYIPEDYQMLSLEELACFVKANHHLPGVEIGDDKIDIIESNRLNLEKIEEMSLYILELKKEMEEMQLKNDARIQSLENQIQLLKNK